MSPKKTPLVAVFWLLCHVISKAECSHFSAVHPEKVQLLVGSSVDIYCTQNFREIPGRNSSHLFFQRKTGDEVVPQSSITIVNATTIKWRVENASETDSDRYTCFIRYKNGSLRGVGLTTLSIGHKPTEIKDFKCRSYNWQNMACTFTKPLNPVPTEYKVNYTTNVHNHYWLTCNMTYNNNMVTCLAANYQLSHEKYTFYVTMVNDLGDLVQKFEINHFASIIPAVPEQVNYSDITSDSVTIQWGIPYNLIALESHIDFVHDVRLKSEFEQDFSVVDPNLIKIKPTEKSEIIYFVRLSNLKYANANYEIKVRIRVKKAVAPDEMWSEPGLAWFRTSSRKPDRPPQLAPGSFYVNDYGEVTVFWKELEFWERNGENLTYRITEAKKDGASLDLSKVPFSISHIMAKFQHLSPTSSYEFTIKSVNADGMSDSGSSIVVPRSSLRPQVPTKLKKVSLNGTYNISWSPTLDSLRDQMTYTIFWCRPKNSLPNACEGGFDFDIVDQETLRHTVNSSSESSLNFAISANSPIASSGMVWIMCTAANPDEIGQIKTIWVTRIEATQMEIQWKLECEDSTIVRGYNLSYCPVKSQLKMPECREPEKVINISNTGGTVTKYNITGLKPYTRYKTVVSMFSETREGPKSRPLENTTLESAPSPPREFMAHDIKNTSMKLQWRIPEFTNGVLMKYEIYYNGQKKDIFDIRNKTTNELYDVMEYELQNLTSFTLYELLVRACTGFCSENSNKDRKKTSIGSPGIPKPPKTSLNNSILDISWEPPAVKGGHIEFYELRTVVRSSSNEVSENVVRICGNRIRCRRRQLCKEGIESFEFFVRAVNVIFSPYASATNVSCASYSDHLKRYVTLENASHYEEQPHEEHRGRHHHVDCEDMNDPNVDSFLARDPYITFLPGNWSEKSLTNCYHTSSIEAKTIVTIFLSIAVMFCMLYLSYNFYKKIKDMKNIIIILPPGVEEITKEIKPSDLEGKKGKSQPDIGMEINGSLFAAEEEDRLLRRRTETNSSGRSDQSQSNSDSVEDIAEDNTYDAQQLMEEDTNSADSVSTDQFKGSTNSFGINDTPLPPIVPAASSTPTHPPTNTRFPVMSNGYVKPNMIRSGYVQPGAAMSSSRPTTSGGYVPVNQFGRPVLNAIPPENTVDMNNVKISMKTPIVASTDAHGISGYVTHKQLSDFGHRMQ